MSAGALGIATSRSLFHRSTSGDTISTLDADQAELLDMALALGEPGGGIMQVAVDFSGTRGLDDEFGLISRLSKISGHPVTVPIAQVKSRPDLWRDIVDNIVRANADGAQIAAQALPRGIGLPSPSIAHNLPKGGRRLRQRAEGYVATIVNGAFTYRNGIATGHLPGMLVRGRQTTPTCEPAAEQRPAA